MRILAKSRRLATGLAALAIGIAPPAAAQTVTPSSGVWSTTSSGATVTASTVAKDNTAPFTLTIAQPTGSGAYPVTVYASLMGVYPNWATNTYSYGGPVYQLTGTGTQGSVSNAQEGYIVGPNFNATIGSASTVYSIWNTGASATPATANSLGGTPALLAVSSTGAPGAVSYGTKHPGGGILQCRRRWQHHDLSAVHAAAQRNRLLESKRDHPLPFGAYRKRRHGQQPGRCRLRPL